MKNKDDWSSQGSVCSSFPFVVHRVDKPPPPPSIQSLIIIGFFATPPRVESESNNNTLYWCSFYTKELSDLVHLGWDEMMVVRQKSKWTNERHSTVIKVLLVSRVPPFRQSFILGCTLLPLKHRGVKEGGIKFQNETKKRVSLNYASNNA